MNNFVTEKCNTCEQCKSELKQVEDKKYVYHVIKNILLQNLTISSTI